MPDKWMVLKGKVGKDVRYRVYCLKSTARIDSEENRIYAYGWVKNRRGAQDLADWLNESDRK